MLREQAAAEGYGLRGLSQRCLGDGHRGPSTEYPQKHICDWKGAWQANALACSGADWRQHQRRERNADFIEPYLDRFCEPIPDAPAFLLKGIRHRNDNGEEAGVPWDAVRALGPKKVHYLAKLTKDLW